MTESKNLLVSVIVPVYNVEKFLKQCTESILAQTHKNLEIILVDDGATDKSGEMCDVIAHKDKRVRVIHKENGGLNSAREAGFAKSSGEWIAFIDSDDVIDEQYIEALLEANLQHRTEIAICEFAYFTSDIKKDATDISSRVEDAEKITRLYLTDTRPDEKFFLQTAWAKLFSRRIMETVDWDFCDYRSNEDEIMSIYYYKGISKVSFVDNRLYYYRRNPESITGKAKIEYKNSYKGKPLSRLEFLDQIYWKRLKMFGEAYKDEITYCFSMHFMVYINTEYRKNSSFRLSRTEADMYNSKLIEICKASKKYKYYDEYHHIYETVEAARDIRAFFEYRKNNPLISIIIPVYNVEPYIRKCLESVMAQSYRNLEIILVDDGATDKSGEVCDEYVEKDDRVRIIHRENGGVSSARNEGLKQSSGEYVLFVDADDFIDPKAVKHLVNNIQVGEKSIDIIIGDKVPYHTQGYTGAVPSTSVPSGAVFSCETSDSEVIHGLLTEINSVFYKLFRRELLVQNRIDFPEHLKIAEDLVFVARAFFVAKTMYFTGEPLYFYRTDFDNNHSAMGQISESKAFDFGAALKLVERYASKSGMLKRQQVKEALKQVVVTHGLYALEVVEKDAFIHKEVFSYLRDDLFVHFKIHGVAGEHSNKVALIVNGEYETFLMKRLQETKQYLYNRLDAIGYMEHELQKKTEQIEEIQARMDQMQGEVADLRGEVSYHNSIHGMIRTPFAKIYRRLKRIVR